jgi:hypothetical protein
LIAKMQGTQMQIKARPGAAGVRAPKSRTRLSIAAKQYSGPPPAWNKRVVVPEVEPRDGPKVGRGSRQAGPAQAARAGQVGEGAPG